MAKKEKFKPKKIGRLGQTSESDYEITEEEFDSILRSSFAMSRETKQFINADAT